VLAASNLREEAADVFRCPDFFELDFTGALVFRRPKFYEAQIKAGSGKRGKEENEECGRGWKTWSGGDKETGRRAAQSGRMSNLE
jgi:hypothetical protein